MGSFVYDPNGRLFQSTINGTTIQYLYDGDALVAEYSGATVQRRYVHGDQVDEPLVQYNSNLTGASYRRYLHTDHQGSIIAHSDSTGSVFASNGTLAYDAYGIPAAKNNSVQGAFGYTGQVYFPALGLNYYKARFYHPKLGRFLQTDPIGYKDDMDLYSYVGNDPMNKADPTGTDSVFSVNPDAADGNGHTTLYMQYEDDWYSYNQGAAGSTSSGNGNFGMLLGLNAPAGVSILRVDASTVPTDGLRIATSREQDKMIFESAAASAVDHNSGKLKYNLYSNNCTDAAVAVVNKSGAGITVSNPSTTVRPNSWIKNAKAKNKSSKNTSSKESDGSSNILHSTDEVQRQNMCLNSTGSCGIGIGLGAGK